MKIINPILICTNKCVGIVLVMLFSFVISNSIHAAMATVNNIGDAPATNPAVSPDSTLGVGIITLRSSIQYLNAQAQPSNTIDFNISGTGPFTIQPQTDLDSIQVPVLINGYSQVGSSVNTLANGDNAVLKIILNGSNYTVGDGLSTGNGLHFIAGSDGSIVKGLVINQWIDNGILIDGTTASINGIEILGNFIGTDVNGTVQMANRTGIGISGATNAITNTIIGSPVPADRNLISGSFAFFLQDDYSVQGAALCSVFNSGTLIQGNYIGVDHNGTQELGNSVMGVVFITENESTIGGATPADGNLISGQTIYGIDLTGQLPFTFIQGPGCTNCIVQGNKIGTDLTGNFSLGNANAGIEIDSFSTNNTIMNNQVSGNGFGINIGKLDMPGSSLNIVQQNLVGTDNTGTLPLGNTRYGIVVNDTQNNVQNNVISGNGKSGLLIYGAVGTNTLVISNRIGTDKSATKKLGNGENGVQIGLPGGLGGGSNNTIGS